MASKDKNDTYVDAPRLVLTNLRLEVRIFYVPP